MYICESCVFFQTLLAKHDDFRRVAKIRGMYPSKLDEGIKPGHETARARTTHAKRRKAPLTISHLKTVRAWNPAVLPYPPYAGPFLSINFSQPTAADEASRYAETPHLFVPGPLRDKARGSDAGVL